MTYFELNSANCDWEQKNSCEKIFAAFSGVTKNSLFGRKRQKSYVELH